MGENREAAGVRHRIHRGENADDVGLVDGHGLNQQVVVAGADDRQVELVIRQVVPVIIRVRCGHFLQPGFHQPEIFFRGGLAGKLDGGDLHRAAEFQEIPVNLFAQVERLNRRQEIGRIGYKGSQTLPGDDQLFAPQLLQRFPHNHPADGKMPAQIAFAGNPGSFRPAAGKEVFFQLIINGIRQIYLLNPYNFHFVTPLCNEL